MKKLINLLILLLILVGCEDKDENTETPQTYNIKGKVEKGPFAKGSKITLQPLDAELKPLGTSYTEQIINEEGDFNFDALKLTSPYAQLIADGYYFNEVEGRLSRGQISLFSLVDLSDQTTINVNILTHLKRERVKQLMESEKETFNNASKQAQLEILSSFGLQRFADEDASRFSVTTGTGEAASLIVISSSILKNRSDAEITEYLAKLSTEYKNSISEETKKELNESCKAINWDYVTENIKSRYNDLGKDVHIKNLSYYVDWDGDGIAGNELGGEEQENTLSFEQKTLFVPANGGIFSVDIETNISFSLENPFPASTPPISTEDIRVFEIDPIESESSIVDKQLKLSVKPASSILMEEQKITIYSLDGKLQSTLTISQEGDKNKAIKISSNGESFLASIYYNSREALSTMYLLESLYSQCYEIPQRSEWIYLYNHQVNPGHSYLGKSFGMNYSILSNLGFLQSKYASVPIIKAATRALSSMIYYEMATLWGNVPYVSKYDNGINNTLDNIIQLDEAKLFQEFESDLLTAIEMFRSSKTQHTVEQMFFPSKDVPQGLLARMYLHTKQYEKAIEHFNAIIESNNYSIDINCETALGENGKELLYGYSTNSYDSYFIEYTGRTAYIPVLSYTEILLSTAEAYYKIGNIARAEAYLNTVINVKGIPEIYVENFMDKLELMWKQELKGTGSYFAFLKRNNLAIERLQVEEYQLLLPIPQQEIDKTPTLKQNQGY